MKLRVLKSESDFDSDFIDQILELDRANMQTVLEECGIEFPEQNRREGLKKNPTLIVAENQGEIAGYLEYTRSWSDPEVIYISSIQIDKNFRRSKLILRLIDKFVETVRKENFKAFETNVQKNNLPAAELYRKIGFKFDENPRNPASWRLTADRRILSESRIKPLLDKWRKRLNKQGLSKL